MLCTEIVFDIQNNFCTKYVLPMFCIKKSFWQRFIYTVEQNESSMLGCIETILKAYSQYGVALEQINKWDG